MRGHRAWRQVREYQERKSADPDNPMWSLRLAEALDKLGNAEQARREYHEAASKFLRLGFARKARAVYLLILDRFPDDIDAKYGNAVAIHEYREQTGSMHASVREQVLRFADDDELQIVPRMEVVFDAPEATLEPDDFDFGDMDRTPTPADPEADERRRAPRIEWRVDVDLFDGRHILQGVGCDVSTTGLRVEVQPEQAASLDGDIQLSIGVPDRPWTGTAHGRVVRRVSSSLLGVKLQWIDELTLRHLVHTIATYLCVSPRVIREVHRDATRPSRQNH